MKLELAIINVEMDAGIFERHLGTLEIEKRNRPLQKEVKEKHHPSERSLGARALWKYFHGPACNPSTRLRVTC
jgi:hypothetical protein